MTTLRIKDVKKRYPNGAEAVKGVSVDVEDGELVVFVGPVVNGNDAIAGAKSSAKRSLRAALSLFSATSTEFKTKFKR